MRDWDGKTERRRGSFSGVDNLATFIRGEFKNFETKLDEISREQRELRNDLYGKDSDTPGIKMKVDRLEQDKKRAEKHLFVVYTTAITLLLKSLWDWFSGGK